MKKKSKQALREYESKLANDKHNPKRLLAYIISKRIVSNQISALTSDSNQTNSDGVTKANILNNHFQSAFSKEPLIQQLNPFALKTKVSTSDITIDQNIVLKHLKMLDGNKSMGNDNISPFVLKSCATSMTVPLTLIFQLSIESGKVPSDWLTANVTPIYKKGTRTDPADYRPISLTSITCKLMEKIVRQVIIDHLVYNKLLSNTQHGFISKKTCVTNLLETMDFFTHSKSKKKPIDLIFLDFAKAFDKVSHSRLLQKLEMYGIKGNLLSWIKAFLTNRKQRVILGDSISDWINVTIDVP